MTLSFLLDSEVMLLKNELMNTDNRNNNVSTQSSAKKDGGAGKLLLAVFGVLLLVVVIVAVVIITGKAKGKFGDSPAPVTDETDNENAEIILEASIQALGLMDTASNYYTHVSTNFESKELFGIAIPGTGNSYVIIADGKITAGVDFSLAKVTFDEEKGEFTVRLPKAKVLTNVLDKDSWQYFDEKGDVFKPLTVEEVGDSYNDIAKEEEEKAIARGLLDDAEKMAQTIAMNYLSENAAVGDNKITLVFGAK